MRSRERPRHHLRRLGFLVAEIVRHGRAAIWAAVSPYRAARDERRHLVGTDRGVAVLVDTPLAECERRDRTGVYAKARRGEIKAFAGIDALCEAPGGPEITLEPRALTPEQNAQRMLPHLAGHGLVR